MATGKPKVKPRNWTAEQVHVALGHKVNIGNYESVDLQCGLSVTPHEDSDPEEVHAELVSVVEAMLQRQIDSCPYVRKKK